MDATSGNAIPRSKIPLKDVGLFEHFARSAGVAVPLATQVREILDKQ